MLKEIVVMVLVLGLVGCGEGREVVTEESYRQTKDEQKKMAQEMGSEAVEKVERGLTCVEFSDFPTWPPYCEKWCPDTVPGMYSCYSDPTVYAGETNVWFQANYQGGCCQGWTGDGDFSQLNAETNDQIRSAKSRRSGGVYLWSETNYWGNYQVLYMNDTPNISIGVSSIANP